MSLRVRPGVCLLSSLLLLFSLPAAALEAGRGAPYLHTAWQTDEGLPQNSVTAIVQTRDGYLWLATQEGLARFDGMRFTVFDKRNTPALAENNIQALYEQRDGTLWVGTEGCGGARLKDHRFTAYGIAEGLGGNIVDAICEDREGTLWVGTRSGLSRLRDGRFTTYTTKNGLANDSVWATLYVSVYNYASEQDGPSGIFKSTNGGTSWAQTSFGAWYVSNICIDPRNPLTVYAGTWGDDIGSDKGVFKSTDGGATWKPFLHNLAGNPQGYIEFSSLIVDPRSPTTIYVCIGGIQKSVNLGDDWTLIDPVPTSSSFAVDSTGTLFQGRIYLTNDAFVLKLNPTATALEYSTFLGGGDSDGVSGMAVDPQGYVTIFGGTASSNFPTTADALQRTRQGNSDLFLARFSPEGQLVYSTLGGGQTWDTGRAFVMDSAGDAYVTGVTESTDFPVVNALLPAMHRILPDSPYNRNGGFLAKLRFSNAEPPPVAPVVTSVTPAAGPTRGGTRMTIKGKGFVAGTTVTVGEALAAIVTVSDAETVVATTDRHAAGMAAVVVTNPNGQSSRMADAFRFVVTPAISSVAVSGKKLTLVGESFGAGAVILVNNEEQATVVDEQSAGTRLISKKAGKRIKPGQSVTLQVRNPDGVTSAAFSYTRPAE